MTYKTIHNFDVNGKRVLVRADLNVPRQGGKVTDTARIDRLRPTIDYLVGQGAKTVVLSHFGRPDGEQNPQMSLAFLIGALEERWGRPVKFAQDCIGEKAQRAVESLGAGEVLLLENVRFHKGEKANDPDFVKSLAVLGDVFIQDAFSAAHRAHASTYGLADHLPTGAGLLMMEELQALEKALEAPDKPVMAVVGGSKISTKLNVLNNLIEKVDYLVLGGAMANTFLYAQGHEVGASMCEKDMAEEARHIMTIAESKGCQIIVPLDVVVVRDLKTDAEHEIVTVDNISENMMAIDVGPKTVAHIQEVLKTCKTVLWNGPMGVFEIKPFDAGTNAVANAVADLTVAAVLQSVAGGGDTVSALDNAGVLSRFTYISTAGGAFLEWLEGKVLPGVEVLNCKDTA